MLFADTSYLVSLFVANDERHTRALQLITVQDRLVSTDHVFSEFITMAMRRAGHKSAYEFGKHLLQSDITFLDVVAEDLLPALGFVKSHPNLSMCDALSAVLMTKLGIRKILSFDSDFDRLGFERLY
jgi:predicted nucleic acid-binding protein